MGTTPELVKSAALRWFGEQPRLVQVEALKLQTDLIRQSRAPGVKSSPEILLEHLIEACRKMKHEEDSLRLKAKLTQEQARKIHERKITRFKAGRLKGKPSPKREAIRLKYFHEVQDLRHKEGFGWRNCAAYLRESHKFKVTHAYLRDVIEDLERLEGAKNVNSDDTP
jgi:hypothetical protein